jgi:phosphoglycolate phosphatase
MSNCCLIFDYDGTLVNTADAIIACMTDTLRGVSPEFDLSPERIRSVIGKSLEENLEFLSGGKVSGSILEQCATEYRKHYSECSARLSRPFDGVASTLARLRELDIPMFLVSNKGEAALRGDLARFGLSDCFAQVYGADKVLRKKPDPWIYTQEIRRLIPEGSKVLMVGDTIIDIKFAKAIKAESIWAKYGYGDPEECEKASPDYILENFTEVLKILS